MFLTSLLRGSAFQGRSEDHDGGRDGDWNRAGVDVRCAAHCSRVAESLEILPNDVGVVSLRSGVAGALR